MTLPQDICRCHDAKCPERETCLRWLDRVKILGEPLVHANSFRSKGLCWHKIDKEAK